MQKLFSDLTTINYANCTTMQSQGVFVTGQYLLAGSSSPKTCQLWSKYQNGRPQLQTINKNDKRYAKADPLSNLA